MSLMLKGTLVITLTYWIYLINILECLPTTKSKIVSKVKLSIAGCVDGSGAQVNHGDNWTSAPGVCDNNICYVVFSGKFVVQERCRPLGPTENPDTLNCQMVSENSKPFPDCCPKLSCTEPPDPSIIIR